MMPTNEITALEAELRQVRHDYFTARRYDDKKKLRKKDRAVCEQLAIALETSGECSGTDADRLAKWNPYNTNLAADFFDPGWMFGIKDGFDISIGNPPYVRQEEIKEFKPLFKEQFECFTGVADLYVYFYERSFQILKIGGVLSFISSNKYFRAGYGQLLRWFLSYCGNIRLLLDFGDAPVFTAIAYPSIIVAQKKLTLESGQIPKSKIIHPSQMPTGDNSVAVQTWDPILDVADFPAVFQRQSFGLVQRELKPDGWRLESPAALRLLEKLRRAGQPLGEYVKGRFYRGILTGLNEAFVVDRTTRDRLIAEHPSSAEILKPFLRGRDVKRWRVEPQDLWLIFTRHGIDIIAYPAIHEYLKNFKKRLMPGTPNGRKPGNYKWYEIQDNIAYWQEFEQSKIIIPAIAESTAYASDTKGFFSNDKTSICVASNLNYTLALLNSSVLWWLIRKTAATKQGGFYEFKPMYVSQIPIPNAPTAEQKTLENLVDRIITLKQCDSSIPTNTNSDNNIATLEREIDERVYRLFALTLEEIQIMEECTR